MGGRSTAAIGWLVLAAALGGCAAFDNLDTGNLYIQPGKFQFLKCQDLAERYVAASRREHDMRALMGCAGNDTVRTLIGATTYGIDIKQVRAEAQQLQQTMIAKGCPNTVPM